jgi:hypothetical protein
MILLRRSPVPVTIVTLALGLAVHGCSKDSNSGGGSSAASATTTAAVSTSLFAPGSGSVPGTPAPAPTFWAGASAVDATPPVGVPLAGYGNGNRRLSFPDLDPFNYHTFLRPSSGVRDPVYAKALVLDDGTERVCIVALDAIATEGMIVELAVTQAQARGFSLPLERVLVCSSHTHSGPGTVSTKIFWELNAADLFHGAVRQGYVDAVADALVAAEQAIQPARIGVSTHVLAGVTKNRREQRSRYLDRDDVDEQLGILRVDDLSGNAIATVWNYAIHGTVLGKNTTDYSADIMGEVNRSVEATAGGVSLFLNGPEGDISPADKGSSAFTTIAPTMIQAVLDGRAATTTQDHLEVRNASEWVDFGPAAINVRLIDQLYHSQGPGPLNLLGFLHDNRIDLTVPFPMDDAWVETRFRFQAIRVGDALLASIPGEAITSLGEEVRADGLAMGFGRVLVCGLANNHMSYVTTEREYWEGGYEALATFWGPTTGARVRQACASVANRVKR